MKYIMNRSSRHRQVRRWGQGIGIMALIATVGCPAEGQQIDSADGSISLTLRAPTTACSITSVGDLNFGTLTRYDTCNRGNPVTITASATSGSITSANSSCVSQSGGGVASVTARGRNAKYTVTMSGTSATLKNGSHSIAFSGVWAVSTGGSYTSLSNTSYERSVSESFKWVDTDFRIGGTISIGPITADSQEGTYSATSAITFTVSCS